MAWCIVDRPDARNALTPSMYFGIRRAVELVNRDPKLAGLIITGTGEIFIPGGELRGRDPGRWIDPYEVVGWDHLPFETLRRSAKPIVSAVNGLVQGGGLLIAMLSDVALLSDRARLRVPELLVGVADAFYAQILPAHVGVARARDLMFTAREFSANEAVEWGLVTRVVSHDELEVAATSVMSDICRSAPAARRQVKRIMHERYGSFDRFTFDDSMLSAEFSEGKSAFAERRDPDWIRPEFSIRRPDSEQKS